MNNETVILNNDSKEDLIKQIQIQAVTGSQLSQIINIANAASKISNLDKQLEFVFDTVYDIAVFKLSPDDRQQVRTVANILRTGLANCTGYVTIIASILLLLKIPFNFRLVNTHGNGFNHIYIIAANRFVLDPCIGQRQDDTDTRENRPTLGAFNKEVNFQKKKTLAC